MSRFIKNKYVYTLIMLLVLSLSGYFLTLLSSDGEQEKNMDFQIVTSFYPMYIAALNVADGIEGVSVKNMTESVSGCLHEYQMTPEDMRSLVDADALIVNGGGMENFLEKVMETYPSLNIIDSSKEVETIVEDEEEINAHFWMNIKNYEKQIETIEQELQKLDPAHAEEYRKNAEHYRKELQKLMEEAQTIISNHAGEKIVAFHEAFSYFAKEYELEIVKMIDMDDNTSLGAKELSEVMEAVNEEGVKILLAEEKYGKSVADAVASWAEAKVVILDPLTSGSRKKDAYLRGMENNLKVLREVLS